MGLVSRNTVAALLAAAPLVVGSVTLSGTATAYESVAAQADPKVGTTIDLKFDPPSIKVAAGQQVTWTNTGGGPHTVTGGDGVKDPSSPMQGVIQAEGATYAVTFEKPGTYKYFCEPHLSAGMTGEVVVTAAGGTSATPAASTPAPPAASSVAPASASASASVGAPQEGAGAPTAPVEEGEEAPGIEGNETLEDIEARRASLSGAVSGFRFFAAVAVVFLFVLSAAVLFSTRPRSAGK